MNLQRQLSLLPDALAGHLLVTAIPLAIGIAVSVPLGILLVRRRFLREAALSAAGVVQTVPGLAFLALMVPILVAVGGLLAPLGITVPALGPLPVGIALTAYAMLPILRNTIVGIAGVDPSLREAGLALGMTPGQVRRHVEIPLAMPVILAGIRTAAVWVVGLGTLATPVGARSLGDFIFSGLQTRNPTAVLVGCLGAAALALVLDAGIAAFERRRYALGAGILAVLAAAAIGPRLGPRSSRPVVVVGGKPFTEQYVLTRLMESRLEAAGFAVDRRDSLGSTVLLDALLAGEVDVAVDYSGTLWANHLKRTETAPPEVVRDAVCAGLQPASCLGALGFENAYALAVKSDRWKTLWDLAADAPGLRMGADYEFLQRPEWAAVRAAYGLSFAAELTFDPTFLYDAVATGQADVITAYTTDGRVSAFGLTLLDDPLGALPPYDAVLLLSADCPPGVAEALRPLIGAIDAATMREANRRVDLGGETPEAAAAWIATRLP
ncbi:MAG: ABC transporter permease/substrate-binding protein [Deltaproteobacteria bacterium]|nr:ABC transporter permease/substrate-binding protein [Deltaproteobacteria bacterium]